MLQLLLDNNLYLAPITSPRVRNPSSASVRRLLCAQRVLDVGTGTGIWYGSDPTALTYTRPLTNARAMCVPCYPQLPGSRTL